MKYLVFLAGAFWLAGCSRSRVIVDSLACSEPPPNVAPMLLRASQSSADSAGVVVIVRSHYPGNAPGDTLDLVSLSFHRSRYIAGREIQRGVFWFPGLAAGEYRVDARRIGHAQLVDSVNVRPGFRDTLIIGLRPQTHCLT